jgi:hypothetical protein
VATETRRAAGAMLAPGACTGEAQQPLDYTDGFLNTSPHI